MRRIMKKISKKMMAILLSMATVFSSFAPLTVFADAGYVVTFTFGDGYTAEADNKILKVYSGEDTGKTNPMYTELRTNASDNTSVIGSADCTSDTACTITVSSDTPTYLTTGVGVYSGENPFSLDTAISGNMTLTLKNNSTPQNPNVNDNIEVTFDTDMVAGNQAAFTVDSKTVTVDIGGADINNKKVLVPRNNLGSVTFTLNSAFDKDTMQVVIRGANSYSTELAVNNGVASLVGLNIPDGGLHFSVEAINNGGGNPVNPGDEPHTGDHFDGKAYLIWSCKNGGICFKHFDNIPNFDDGNSTFYKASGIIDDRTGEAFDVKASYKGWSTDAKFNNWVNAYKTYKGIEENENIDWSKVDPKDMIGDPIDVREYEDQTIKDGTCSKQTMAQDEFEACVDRYVASLGKWTARAQLQPVGEPTDNNAYVSYGDRNFKVVVYNSKYKGITIGDLSDLNYYPAEWSNPFIRQDQYDISDTTKEKPTYVNAVLLEKTLNIKALNYNGFEIVKLEALDVPSDAVSISKANGEWKLVFSSNFYDNVVFKATDNKGEVSYFAVKRSTVDAWINNVDNTPHLYAEVYYDRNNTYTDFNLSANITYKDGTTEKVKLTHYNKVDDGLGNISEVNEEDQENPKFGPAGKGLKKAVFVYKLPNGKSGKDIKKAYINVEYKGSTSKKYAGAFAGSGKGILANIYQEEEK